MSEIPEVLIKFTGRPVTPEFVEEIRKRLIEAQRTGRVNVIPPTALIEQFDDPDLTTSWPDGWDWTRRETMIPFLKKYAVDIVAAIGTITTLATALGLQHQHYVAVVLGVLSTVAVVLTKFFTITRPAAKAAASSVK